MTAPKTLAPMAEKTSEAAQDNGGWTLLQKIQRYLKGAEPLREAFPEGEPESHVLLREATAALTRIEELEGLLFEALEEIEGLTPNTILCADLKKRINATLGGGGGK